MTFSSLPNLNAFFSTHFPDFPIWAPDGSHLGRLGRLRSEGVATQGRIRKERGYYFFLLGRLKIHFCPDPESNPISMHMLSKPYPTKALPKYENALIYSSDCCSIAKVKPDIKLLPQQFRAKIVENC